MAIWKKLYYLDKLGWPIEIIKGHHVDNFIRRLIHTRKITTKRPSCLDPQPCKFNVVGSG